MQKHDFLRFFAFLYTFCRTTHMIQMTLHYVARYFWLAFTRHVFLDVTPD